MGDGGIFYIEDPGQKRINKIYFSKTNMSLYKCTADNTDVTVTGNFKLYSLSNTDDYLGALTGVDRGQVKYIQDVGTKYVDKVYIDRPTGKLYRCVTQTSSVNNDANFVENNLKSTDGKLQNLEESSFRIIGSANGMDLNDLIVQGVYDYHIEGGLPSNLPIGVSNRGTITVLGRASHRSQIIIDFDANMFVRYIHAHTSITCTKWFKISSTKLES
ncbi:MAG: pyocin knob domain-containing protein [Cetobacterium sp.]|uniref:pyocin knob domain-containing protein n=1 Tax=Cetobacterium sp. TaxID=2071632 RepID=UPI003F2B9531